MAGDRNQVDRSAPTPLNPESVAITEPLGQDTMAGSISVVIASDQTPVPVLASIDTTGLATEAKQTTGNASLSSIDGKTPALGQALMAASSPVVIANDQSSIPVTVNNPSLNSTIYGPIEDYQPGYSPSPLGTDTTRVDPAGNLITRSQVLTDEGGYRFGASGSSIDIVIPNCSFQTNSPIVTTTGDFSDYDIHKGDYIKYELDGEQYYVQIDTISISQINLVSDYLGSIAAAANATCSVMKTVTGAGGSIVIGSGVATITAGTTGSSIFELERDVDILPLVKEAEISISQRITKQDIYLGFYDESATSKYWAWFHFNGTDNETVICETARTRGGAPTATDQETTTVAIPENTYTNSMNKYRVEAGTESVRFLINGVIVAEHKKVIIRPFDVLTSTLRIVNGTSPATSTVVTVNYDYCLNYNKVAVGLMDNDQVLFRKGQCIEGSPGMPMKPVPMDVWRASFHNVVAANGVDPKYFTLKQTGAGMGISQASGNLLITGGTTANAETIIRSLYSVKDSWAFRYNMLASQRIINTSLIFELVDIIGDGLTCTVNSATSITVTIPNNPFSAENVGQFINVQAFQGFTGVTAISGRYAIASVSGNNVNFTVASFATGAGNTGTCSLTGWNYHNLTYTGATATNVTLDTQRCGWNSGAETLTINTTASPGHLGILTNDDGLVSFADQLIASSAVNPVASRGSKVVRIPGTNAVLYLQIRCVNGTTNPVSGTTWTIGSVSIENYSAMPVTINSGRTAGVMNTVPVSVLSVPSTVVTATNLSTNVAQLAGTATVNGGLAGTLAVGGLIAADSAYTVTYKPVVIGGLAKNSTTLYSVSADGDAINQVYTLDGKQIAQPYQIPELTFQYATPTGTPITNTTDVVLKANVAGQRPYLTSIQYVNTHATVDTLVVVKDGSTVIWTGYADSHIANTPAVPIVVTFPVPLRGSVNAALNFACITTGANVFVSAQGYMSL